MPAPNRSGSQSGSSYAMPNWWDNYWGLNGGSAPTDPRANRKIAPDSYAPGGGAPDRSATASSAPTASAKPAYVSKYGGLTTGNATQSTGIDTGFDPMSPDSDVDTLLGEGKPLFVEQEQKDPSQPYTYTPNKAATPEGRSNQSTKTNELGVEQTGTNTSAINMPGLADMDMTGIANFNGPSFPTQGGTNKITNNYSFTASEFLTNPKNEDGSAFEAPGGTPTTTNIAINGNTFRPNSFEKPGQGAPAGLDGFKPGGEFSGAPTATDGLSDDGWGAPDPASYATSGEEMRRRAAFLDSSGDSLKAMDNVAKGMGMGRGFANVDGEAVAMSSSDRRKVLQAAPGEAQALKDKWVKALSTEQADEPQIASSAQNPTEDSGTSTFVTDKKTDLSTKALGVDYSNNNADANLSIDGLGGNTKMNAGAFNNNATGFENTKASKFYLPK